MAAPLPVICLAGPTGCGKTAAALALAFDRDRLPNRAGVLTPASGIGDALVERLREGGMKIEARKVK